MNLIDIYREKCRNNNWYDKYVACGDNADGSIFKCFSTNYRNINSFKTYFQEFKKYIGIPRDEWDRRENTGQEKAKQHVVNMVDSFLYLSKRNKDSQLIYQLSKRGENFDNMLASNFSENEEKFLILLYLINASFLKQPRYLLKQSWQVWDTWNKIGLNELYIKTEIKQFIISESKERLVNGIFKYDIVWYLSFYTDIDFLKLYRDASEEEKEELINNTIEDYETINKKNHLSYKYKTDVLSYKYKSTNFQKPALFDTLLIIYLSKFIKDCQFDMCTYEDFYKRLINTYSELYEIDEKKIQDYIFSNDDIFNVIYLNAISEEDDFTETYIVPYKNIKTSIEELEQEKIDSTSQEGITKLEVVRTVLKNMAKDKSNHKCALEQCCGCQNFYFTSKESGKNYLEIHHLIPREFSYLFDNTIELIENYIPLCPRCHRMIHKAVDRERIILIRNLFNSRKDELKEKGIEIDFTELKEFYRIKDA